MTMLLDGAEYDDGCAAGDYLKATWTKSDAELELLAEGMSVGALTRALACLEYPNPPGTSTKAAADYERFAAIARRSLERKTPPQGG